jgi:hypothetical protein
MAEALSAILARANEAGHIEGVIPHLISRGLTHLQYADDTIIMIKDDDTQIANLKFLLMCFEDMSNLKINFHKSEVVVMGRSATRQQTVADYLNCKLGEFPFMYLGIPNFEQKTLNGIVVVLGQEASGKGGAMVWHSCR